MSKNSISTYKHKQYFTPEILSNFMVSLIPDDNINTVIDLSMGECALLESAKKRWNNASYLGSDIDEILLRKIHQKSPYIKTFLGDSLGNEINFWEEYYSIISKNGFDLALANPPFDFLNRKLVNIGSKNLLFPIEIHFLLKYIEIVREGGYICIILPYGFLSLELYNDLRIEILEKVVIHKIIKIFDNCFKKINTDICLLLLQKREKKSKSIQTNITVEYLDNNYNLQGHTRIDISQSKRFDLEYYHFLQEFQILQDSCKYPISILKEFIVNSKRGRTLANNKDLIVENGTRFLHTTDLKYLYISNKNKRYVKEKSQYFERNYVQIENILIGRVGRKCIGKIAIVTEEFKNSVISDCIICLDIKNIDPYYLTIYLATKYGQIQLKGISRGSGSKYITVKDLQNLKVIIPSENIQKKFRKKYIHLIEKKEEVEYERFFKNMILKLELELERK
jgi:hypothetical protein